MHCRDNEISHSQAVIKVDVPIDRSTSLVTFCSFGQCVEVMTVESSEAMHLPMFWLR
jgi:hypothetical protein